MPAELRSSDSSPEIRVMTSAVLDVAFVLFILGQDGKHAKGAPFCAVRLLAEKPDLVRRLCEFWPSEGSRECEEWLELPVYAAQAGTLFAEGFRPTLEVLEATAASGPTVPPLPTETPEVFRMVTRRVADLASSAARRAEYCALMAELWEFLAPEWQRGLAGSQAAAGQLERRLSEAERPLDVIPRTHIGLREQFVAETAKAVAAGEAIMVPLVLTEDGQFFFGMPGMLLLGFGPRTGRRVAVRRDAGAEAAKRFKVLSDPTRLALLTRLLHGPLSVTDLATYFELSQPTVSVHIKMLREAGLLVPERVGASTLYRAVEETLRAYVNDSLGRLVEASGLPG